MTHLFSFFHMLKLKELTVLTQTIIFIFSFFILNCFQILFFQISIVPC